MYYNCCDWLKINIIVIRCRRNLAELKLVAKATWQSKAKQEQKRLYAIK